MITLEQAKNLKKGQILLTKDGKRWKVTSVKTWKRSPDKVLVGLKHGLYQYDQLDENYLDVVVTICNN